MAGVRTGEATGAVMGEPLDPYEGRPAPDYPPGYPPTYSPGYPPDYPAGPGSVGFPAYQPAAGPPPYVPAYPGYPPNTWAAPNPWAALYGPPGARRPGTLTASAVLGFVTCGLLLIAAIVLFATAATLDAVAEDNLFGLANAVGELNVDGVLDVVAAATLMIGGVQLLGRRRSGLLLTLVGDGLTVAYAIYWIVRTHSNPLAVGWALVFAALAVIGAALLLPASTRTWLQQAPPPG